MRRFLEHFADKLELVVFVAENDDVSNRKGKEFYICTCHVMYMSCTCIYIFSPDISLSPFLSIVCLSANVLNIFPPDTRGGGFLNEIITIGTR